ncbi:MAG: toprim domain-containing protein [Xenophilus sp.]
MSGFVDFARAHGVLINEAKFFASEHIKRCATIEHPKSGNGAYFWDGERGWVFAWDGDARVQWWNDPNARPWTEEEKEAWRCKRDAARATQEREYQRAAHRAAEMLRQAVPGRHDYLIRKKLPDAQGLVLPTGELIVPMRNPFTGDLQGVQVIRWNGEAMRWEKKMTPGMRAKGAVLRLGPRTARETIFCEGYATGLSIEAAARQMRLSAAVMVCFSDSNMAHVAGLMNKGQRYVFADHDKSGAGERAAQATGLPYCMSPTEGQDANDLHASDGLLTVARLLMQVRQQEKAMT